MNLVLKERCLENLFSKHVDRKSSRPLELVHTDVCWPMRAKSIGGTVYFVSFIDDYTIYALLYFLREKSQVFEKFRHMKPLPPIR